MPYDLVPAIPFDRAVYCVDCNLVIDTNEHRCPFCRNAGLYNLARMVEAKAKAKASQVRHAPEN